MQIFKASASFTRPNDTTAYASADLVANSTTAGSVTPLTLRAPAGMQMVKIWRAGITRSSTSITNAAFRVHFYADSPTVANGDNGALSSTISNYQGFIDVVTPTLAFSDDSKFHGIYVNNALAAPLVMPVDKDGKIYVLLEARGAYTPAAQEVFTVDVIGEAYA